MLYALLTRLFGQINLYDFLVFHFYLRKTGHVVGYGMLSLLLLRGWRTTIGPARAWLNKMLLLSWGGTAFVASMDEWHQTFIPSRTGTVHDVILDSIAGLGFLLIAYLWLRRRATARARPDQLKVRPLREERCASSAIADTAAIAAEK